MESERDRVMGQARDVAGAPPMPVLRSLVCPFCGLITEDCGRCKECSGRFDPLSRQATQNQMGPWAIRESRQAFRPGCSFETIARLVKQGVITQDTVVRGPSTHQFWTLARHTPGVSHLLGLCHSCQAAVGADAFSCPSCHVSFSIDRDRQHLGLGPARPLPGSGEPELLAMQAEPASRPPPARSISGQVSSVPPVPVGGMNAGVGDQSGITPTQEQFELAKKSIKRWKKAYQRERFHSRVVMVVSVGIAILGLLFGYLQMSKASEGRVVGDELNSLTPGTE